MLTLKFFTTLFFRKYYLKNVMKKTSIQDLMEKYIYFEDWKRQKCQKMKGLYFARRME